jgi:small subunit ribosomal protein S4
MAENSRDKTHVCRDKIDRRLGENIWGCPNLSNRSNIFRQHGFRAGRQDFRLRYSAARRAEVKGYHGDLMKAIPPHSGGAKLSVKGDTGENLIYLLERRPDARSYRAKFVVASFWCRPPARGEPAMLK